MIMSLHLLFDFFFMFLVNPALGTGFFRFYAFVRKNDTKPRQASLALLLGSGSLSHLGQQFHHAHTGVASSNTGAVASCMVG